MINKLNIRNQADLFEAEKELTYIRLKELQDHPIKGEFDFKHLKDIHGKEMGGRKESLRD